MLNNSSQEIIAESQPLFYAFRLVGFILIIFGILWKNMSRR